MSIHPTLSPLARKSHPRTYVETQKKGTKGTLRIPSKRSSFLGPADVFNGFKLYVERANCRFRLPVGDRLRADISRPLSLFLLLLCATIILLVCVSLCKDFTFRQ